MGVEPRRVNYIAFSGGGESMSAILGGTVSVGINGFAEFAPQLEAGTLRALAISSAERLPGVDMPTLREQGVDVEFENWRSLVAPPGISPADRARIGSGDPRDGAVRRRGASRSRATAGSIGISTGDAFARFVDAEEARVRAILKKLGTGASDTGSLVSVGPVSAAGADRPGRSSACACACARASASRPRQRHASSRDGRRARRSSLVGAGVVLHLLLAERAGFVIAAAVLFWCTARAFDRASPAARRHLRAVGISLGVVRPVRPRAAAVAARRLLAGWF